MGIQAAHARLAVAADNLANLSTPGYRARQALQTNSGRGPVVAVKVTDQPVDLVREMLNQRRAVYDAKANAIALRTQNEMLGTVIDLLA